MREAAEVACDLGRSNRDAAASIRELQAALDELDGAAAMISVRRAVQGAILAAGSSGGAAT